MDITSVILVIMLLMGYVLLFIGIFLMILAILDIPVEKRYLKNKEITPTFSLIAPSHNEEKVIERTIKIFLETIDYPMDKKEFLVVNDGSTDRTAEIVRKYAGKIINAETGEVQFVPDKYANVILVNRPVGGKGKAYVNNDGIKYSTGEIVFIIDADIQVDKNAFKIAARHFSDESVVAVSGYVYAKENDGLWNKFVISEYIMGQKILRRGFNFLGIHYVIPGGCAIMRRSTIQKVGEYASDTLAEDTDFSWRIVIETRGKVDFDPSIKVLADEPGTIVDLWNQRVRWARGNLEVTWKHRHKVGKLKYGKLTTHTYPFWIASQIMPLVFLMSTIAVIIVTITGSNLLRFTQVLAFILGIVFYVSSFAVIGIAKGKYWLETMLTPGFPIVISLTLSMFLKGGIVEFVNVATRSSAGTLLGLVLGMWFMIALLGTYFCLWLSKKGHPKAADMIQLTVFGFWMFSIACTFEAYIMELSGSDRVWIRTVR